MTKIGLRECHKQSLTMMYMIHNSHQVIATQTVVVIVIVEAIVVATVDQMMIRRRVTHQAQALILIPTE